MAPRRSSLWDTPRLRRLVALMVLYPLPLPRRCRIFCGTFMVASLLCNLILTLFVLGLYPPKHSIAACTDFCHSLCSLLSQVVLLWLLETRRVEMMLYTPDLEDMEVRQMTGSQVSVRQLRWRAPLFIYPVLGFAWWAVRFNEWLPPHGVFYHKYGDLSMLCVSFCTLTAWVWYSGPVCIAMLMFNILDGHETQLDKLARQLEEYHMLPSRAAAFYDEVLRSLRSTGHEVQVVTAPRQPPRQPLRQPPQRPPRQPQRQPTPQPRPHPRPQPRPQRRPQLLAFATLAVSLIFNDTGLGFGRGSAYNTEEIRVVLQTIVIVVLTLAVFLKGMRFTAAASRTELAANNRLLHPAISGNLKEAVAVQQIARQHGGWSVWGVRVDNGMMVKIMSFYAAGSYYLITLCLKYFGGSSHPDVRLVLV